MLPTRPISPGEHTGRGGGSTRAGGACHARRVYDTVRHPCRLTRYGICRPGHDLKPGAAGSAAPPSIVQSHHAGEVRLGATAHSHYSPASLCALCPSAPYHLNTPPHQHTTPHHPSVPSLPPSIPTRPPNPPSSQPALPPNPSSIAHRCTGTPPRARARRWTACVRRSCPRRTARCRGRCT